MAPFTKVFVTGITGYIGGTTLDLLLKKESTNTKYEFRALVRSPERAEQDIRPLGIEPVIGSLDDVDIIQREAKNADVVLHFADANHVPAIKAILRGLSERSVGDQRRKRPILIHSSGAGIILDPANGQYKSEEVYLDDDEPMFKAIPQDRRHQDVNLEIRSQDLVGKVDTYIVAPPTIWGRGTGPVNKNSIQIPHHIQLSLRSKQALQVGKGLNVWSRIHVIDLGHLFIKLLEHSLEEPQESGVIGTLPKNTEGYYFAEDGEVSYGDVAQEIAATFKELGFNSSGEVKSVDAENAADVEKYLEPYSAFLLGSNSRVQAVKARKLFGWKPEHKDFKRHIHEEIHRQFNLPQN
ncbi:hypothetical protein BGW38_002484 [Lunasporangiospora selenospora]|uniref:NAD(P)-binding domain-containing protein n=1 Tax=Lunasporangiospora selenospora TaxID=979761 RepID=A0A9P6FT57_9FUNG|nr:hypothetical protein BGW38_002484 [Lunasporangiospora selenospora]